jgi:hypothetical protein
MSWRYSSSLAHVLHSSASALWFRRRALGGPPCANRPFWISSKYLSSMSAANRGECPYSVGSLGRASATSPLRQVVSGPKLPKVHHLQPLNRGYSFLCCPPREKRRFGCSLRPCRMMGIPSRALLGASAGVAEWWEVSPSGVRGFASVTAPFPIPSLESTSSSTSDAMRTVGWVGGVGSRIRGPRSRGSRLLRPPRFPKGVLRPGCATGGRR